MLELDKIIPAAELQELRVTAGETEVDFGLKPGFLMGLLEEPGDWSFIIKVHALLESAVNLLICNHLDKPELELPISRIGIRQRAHLALAMHLLPKDEVRMIEHFGVLRNGLVHNPKNTDFSLIKHLESVDNRKTFGDAFCVAWSKSSGDSEAKAMALSQPHLAIWMSALLVALRSGTAKAQKDIEKLEQQLGKTLLNPKK